MCTVTHLFSPKGTTRRALTEGCDLRHDVRGRSNSGCGEKCM